MLPSPPVLDPDVAEWRADGARKLDRQIDHIRRYEAYFDGHPSQRALRGEQRDIFQLLLPLSHTNWSELVVNSVAERLQVSEFRFRQASEDAWAIWQESNMDSQSEMQQTDALVSGFTFVSVWPEEENQTGVQIVPEHPSQITLVYQRRAGRRRVVAAYKRMVEDRQLVEQVVTADQIVTWMHDCSMDTDGTVTPTGPLGGDPDEVEGNPAGRVNVIELRPAPRTIGWPRSELHSVIPIVDRIGLQIYNRLVAEDFGAFRQVTATGVKLEREGTGAYRPQDNPLAGRGDFVEGRDVPSPSRSPAKQPPPFNVGADRLLASTNKDARFGVLPADDLAGYLNAVEQDVQHMAAITQTPPHYLLGNMINISADGIRAAETGLVSKVRKRAGHLGQGWEDVMRLALSIAEREGADDVAAETVWRNFETRSEGELVDALVKMRSLRVPLEMLWSRWGMSPQEIDRAKELLAAESAMDATVTAQALGAADPYAALLAGQAT